MNCPDCNSKLHPLWNSQFHRGSHVCLKDNAEFYIKRNGKIMKMVRIFVSFRKYNPIWVIEHGI